MELHLHVCLSCLVFSAFTRSVWQPSGLIFRWSRQRSVPTDDQPAAPQVLWEPARVPTKLLWLGAHYRIFPHNSTEEQHQQQRLRRVSTQHTPTYHDDICAQGENVWWVVFFVFCFLFFCLSDFHLNEKAVPKSFTIQVRMESQVCPEVWHRNRVLHRTLGNCNTHVHKLTYIHTHLFTVLSKIF